MLRFRRTEFIQPGSQDLVGLIDFYVLTKIEELSFNYWQLARARWYFVDHLERGAEKAVGGKLFAPRVT